MSVEVEQFSDTSVSFIDEDGYPVSFPAKVRPIGEGYMIEWPQYLPVPRQITLLFNHITPIPTGGYTDRRYVMVRGSVEKSGDTVLFRPEKSYGWDEKKKPFFQYCEEKTSQAKNYLAKLSKNIGRPVKPRLPTAQLLFRATRFPFLTATVAPVLIGAGSAAYLGYFDPLLLLLTLVGASLIHLGLNMTNDYFDHKLGADESNITPTPFSGGSRIIQYGLLTSGQVASLAALFYVAGVAIGLYLALLRGLIPILTVMGVGVLISVAYTAPPLKLAYRGVGEVAVGIGFGPIIVLGSHYVQAQLFSIQALLASVPIGILICLILYVNEIPDAPYDAQAGKRTLVTRLNAGQVISLYKLLLATAYAMIALPVLVGYAPPTALIALATIPTAVNTVKSVKQTYGSPYLMIPALAANIRVATFTGLLHALGFFLWPVIMLLV
ncbi:MAG: 1,4-dihydroxy-2-naphthoate octaprenyltransferase [Candidatus Caldarchaeum sp.]|nr:1,4-dihydroxy-2-naphthoate octaprenyltransferase [Candidatus Caldarchaeum sp.]MDW7977327.1 1,4-dihydroxy-2-naphthoate octaprenyltransferase [Candidatus Caldarchaeum sp.]